MDPPRRLTLDWPLLEKHWFRLGLIDLIQFGQVKPQTLPTKEQVISLAQSELRSWSSGKVGSSESHRDLATQRELLEDLQIAILKENELKPASQFNQLKLVGDLDLIRRARIYRLAGKVVPGSDIDREWDHPIISAAVCGKYPEVQLLEIFQDHIPKGERSIWSAAELYPSVLEYLLAHQPIEPRELCSLLARIIEHNYLKVYPIVRKWLISHFNEFPKERRYLLLRPYLLEKANLTLLDELRRDFGFDDFEYRARKDGTRLTQYPRPYPGTPKYYFGYRQVWHFCEYAPKSERKLLLDYWQEESFDCSYQGFIDWVNFKKKTSVSDGVEAETDQQILEWMQDC